MKKELDTYEETKGLSDFPEWSYCADNQMWYEDAKEVLPQPKVPSEIVTDLVCDIKVDYDVYEDDKWEELELENDLEGFAQYIIGENRCNDCITSGVLFRTPNQEIILNLSGYGVWELGSFIEKLKKSDFATEYIDQFCSMKLIAWTDEQNKTRFVIHSYRQHYKFLETLLDITIDKNLLIENIERIINIWKDTIRDEVRKQEKILKKKACNPNWDNSINHFFPEFKTPVEVVIERQLSYIERVNNIKILFAVENGSRNWGMESSDSDYDVRFVFYRKPNEYLHLDKPKDVLTYALNEEYRPCETHGSLIDMCGFDIYKYLKLLMQSNPTTIEWMFSDVLYYGDNNLSLREEMLKNFNPEGLYHHYFSLCKNNYKSFIETEKGITYKKYLYCMRGLLNAKYVAEFDKIPPLKFTDTVEQLKGVIPESVYHQIHEIIRIKATGQETDKVLRIPILDEYLTEVFQKETPTFEKRRPNVEVINDFIDKLNSKSKTIIENKKQKEPNIWLQVVREIGKIIKFLVITCVVCYLGYGILILLIMEKGGF